MPVATNQPFTVPQLHSAYKTAGRSTELATLANP